MSITKTLIKLFVICFPHFRSLRTLIEKPPITGKLIAPPNETKGFILTPGTVPEAYRIFDTRDMTRLLGVPPPTTLENEPKVYDEFGNNFGDSYDEKRAHRMKLKRTLDDDTEGKLQVL